MNLDELKTTWKEYDRKIQSTQSLTERIITSMISERSKSRLSKVQRLYIAWTFTYSALLIFCIAVFASNPFGYQYVIQYIPVIMYSVCTVIFLFALVKTYLGLVKVDINHDSLRTSLQKIIEISEKPKKLAGLAGLAILTAVVLSPLSFLPKNIESEGLWKALGIQLIGMGVALLLILAAFKLGAFKDKIGPKFKDDLNELNELRAMSEELAGG